MKKKSEQGLESGPSLLDSYKIEDPKFDFYSSLDLKVSVLMLLELKCP